MPAWTWDVDPDPAVTYQCQVDGAGWQPCVSGQKQRVSGDWAHMFSVHAVLLGLAGDDANASYTLDTLAPAAPVITSGPPAEISSDEVSFSFTTEDNSTTECQLSPAYDWTPCSSPFAYGFGGQPDGVYTFSARSKDAAGNTGLPVTLSFTLARPAPPSPAAPAADLPPAAPAPAPAPAGPLLRAGVCIHLFMGTARADALTGSAFGDVLSGLAGNDRLDGAGGDDCVLGDTGDDRLSGGPGNDDVRGLAGNDLVRGDAGNDQLSGGPGSDHLSGGSGNDTIDAADGRRDWVSCGAGRDSVTADRGDRLSGCEAKKLKGRKR
jgi:hypothetical protein